MLLTNTSLLVMYVCYELLSFLYQKHILNSNKICLLTCNVYPLLMRDQGAMSAAFLSLSSLKKKIKWVEVCQGLHLCPLLLTSLQMTLIGLSLSTRCLVLATWAKCCRSNSSLPPHPSPLLCSFFLCRIYFFYLLKKITDMVFLIWEQKKTSCLLLS